MRVVGWKTSSPSQTGRGYGIRISREDRDRFFDKNCLHVTIELDEITVRIQLSRSFWRDCIELRGKEIGGWMIHRGLVPWPKGHPPKLRLEHLGNARFRLSE